MATLNTLDGLLDEQLEKRPLLELAIAPATEEVAPVATAPAKTYAPDLRYQRYRSRFLFNELRYEANMPRRPRINLAGHPQHVLQRGHNREAEPSNTVQPGQMGLDL